MPSFSFFSPNLRDLFLYPGVDDFIKQYAEAINLTPLHSLAALPVTTKIPAPRAVADGIVLYICSC